MQVWIENRHPEMALSEGTLRRCIERLLQALQQPGAEVSIVLVDDEEIADLNRHYLHREGPTNVIAFPMQEGDAADVTPHLLGDVVVSLDTAIREARMAAIPWGERVMALLIHGLLHLVGYDHVGDETRAREMESEEQRMMALVEDEIPILTVGRA